MSSSAFAHVRVDFSMDVVATHVDVGDALDIGGEVVSGVKTTVALPSLMLTEPLTRNEVMAVERIGTLGQCLNTHSQGCFYTKTIYRGFTECPQRRFIRDSPSVEGRRV